MFQHLTPYAGDPILSLVETFKRDPRPHKINLSIGIYFDNDGNMTQPESVKTAEQRVGIGAKAYLPMEGHAGLRAELPKLLFGANHAVIAENRVTTVQTLGGSGAFAAQRLWQQQSADERPHLGQPSRYFRCGGL